MYQSFVDRMIQYARRPELRERPVRTLLRRSYFEAVGRVAPKRLTTLHRSRLRFTPYVFDAPLSESVGRSLFLYGVYEPLATDVFSSLLAPGDSAIDVGAHYGDFTLVAAAKVGTSGSVLAFEPQDEVRAVLENNVRINGIRQVRVFPDALGDRTGEARLYTASNVLHTGGASLSAAHVGQSDRYAVVPVRRLDDVVPDATRSAFRAIKIDVEGAEAAVLRGASTLIDRSQPAVLFEANNLFRNNAGFDSEAFSVLRDHGYVLYGMRPDSKHRFIVEPLDPTRDPTEFREPWLALNLLAVVPGSPCHNRLSSAGHLR